ncbi:MAG TPA: PAS domain-containing protein, partial [Longimicrobium sp.]
MKERAAETANGDIRPFDPTEAPTRVEAPADSLFAGPGEMAARFRATEWSDTPLGPVAGWPAALRTAVRLMLASRVPTSLWCGPTYTLLYNDGYAPILGTKHPGALGRSGAEVWNELWPILERQFAGVRDGGPAVFLEEALLAMERGDGGSEDAWFTYSLSALNDEDGSCLAVYNVAVEITDKVRAREALAAASAQLQDQQMELELANEQLQENAAELEAQTEELQATAAALEERTEEAEEARRAAE